MSFVRRCAPLAGSAAAISLVVLGSALASPRGASAQPSVDEAVAASSGGLGEPEGPYAYARARLRWARLSGGETCVASERLAQMVEERLSRAVFEERVGEADLEVAGSVGPADSGGWRATLVLVRSQGPVGGVRELTSSAESCEALTESVALVLSLMVDLPSPRTTITIPEREAPPARSAAARWYGALGIVGHVGLVPEVRIGPELGVHAAVSDRLRLGVSGSYLVGPDIVRRGAWVSVGAAVLGAAIEWAAYRGQGASVGLRLGGDVGALIARVEGVQSPGNGADVYAAARAGAWVRWRASGAVAGLLRLGVGLPLTRYTFSVEATPGIEDVRFRTGQWTLTLGLLLEVG